MKESWRSQSHWKKAQRFQQSQVARGAFSFSTRKASAWRGCVNWKQELIVTYTKLSNNVGKGQQGPRESHRACWRVFGFIEKERKECEEFFLDYLVSLYRWEVYLFIAMVIITRSCENENIFYDCQKEFGNLFSYMCGLFPTFVESFVRLWKP